MDMVYIYRDLLGRCAMSYRPLSTANIEGKSFCLFVSLAYTGIFGIWDHHLDRRCSAQINDTFKILV